MKLQSFILLTLLCISSLGSALSAQAGSDRKLHIRERWESMSEEERAQFQERMERLRGMSADERKELKERSDRLEERKVEQFEKLGKESKRRLATLEPERREELLRQYFSECERVRGIRLREQLPRDFLERMESGHPDERRSMMRKFRKEMRGQASDRMLHHLRHEMGAPPEVLEEVEGLPMHSRRQAMLEFKRTHIRSRVSVEGPPPGISQDEWNALDELPLEEFFQSFGLRREDERRFEPGGPPGGPPGMGPGGGSDPRGPEGGRGRFGRGPHPPRPGGGPPLGEGPNREGGSPALRELSRLAHPDLDDLMESMQLPPHERREAVSTIVRERCLKYLDDQSSDGPASDSKPSESSQVMEAAELERLRALPAVEFVHELRTFLGRSHGRRFDPAERGRRRDKGRRERRR